MTNARPTPPHAPPPGPPPAGGQGDKAGLWARTGSHLIVAGLAVAAVLGWQAWVARDPGAGAPASPAPGARGATADALPLGAPATPAAASADGGTGGGLRGVAPQHNTPQHPRPQHNTPGLDSPEDSPAAIAARAPVRITLAPAALRVWHNTRVRLTAQPGPEAEFKRFVWHFEDGSDPVEGASVEHVFPESVTDRHITLEAHRAGSTPLVISKRLPIERLAVVPVDGDGPVVRPVPKPRGLRVALLGAGAVAPTAAVINRLLALKVGAIIVWGSAPAAGGAAQHLAALNSAVPLLHMDTTLASVEVPLPDNAPGSAPGSAPGRAPDRAPLTVVRDPLGRVTAAPGGQVWVLGHVALVVHDSRPLASSEAAMQGLQRALRVASAYPSVALLSARPLSPLTDREVVADRAFRIYEHALRSQVQVAISASSGVAYDGRYGGLGVVAVGQLRPLGCARLGGSDHCQAGSLTLLDLPAPRSAAAGRPAAAPGAPRVLHLRLPSLTAWLDAAVLPPSVGKYRR